MCMYEYVYTHTRARVRACVRACVRVCVCVCVWGGGGTVSLMPLFDVLAYDLPLISVMRSHPV